MTSMKSLKGLVLEVLVLVAAVNLDVSDARAQNAPPPRVQVDEEAASSPHRLMDVPQMFVVCTGWHALCSASPDCRVDGDRAYCDCLRVNETHIVATSEIQDLSLKHLTEAKCTNEHPCGVDQAPVCRAIQRGQYKVGNIKYDWVSTYSYRGWCSLLKLKFKACVPGTEGYVGDQNWAVCDAAPCTESQDPRNPEKPLSCQCRVKSEPFVGMNDSCTGEDGGIMSSFPAWAWDFENNTYPFPMPGYEWVRGACAPLTSDALPESGLHLR